MSPFELWERYRHYHCAAADVGLQLDISRMNFDEGSLERMSAPMARALEALGELERGAKANVDEDRMVGHYWLRAPELAPDPAIRTDIERTRAAIQRFAHQVHTGSVRPERGGAFDVVLVIGIGGSALGPQFISDALGTIDDLMIVRLIDNTDPDGIDRILTELDETLAQTLTVVISKSGTTKETRNGMLEVAAAYERRKLTFARHAVAVTGPGSELHDRATAEKWLAVFPLWDWIGGRTSVTSAVGLLPGALQGLETDALLEGARACDQVTRICHIRRNPAALLALMWHYAVSDRNRKAMVVLPYRDRLSRFGRYLQQLVMESVGKERDRLGRVVRQGLTVYGHKGTTDQHAYVQQLLEGPNDFFVTFIDVARDRAGRSIPVEDDVTTGDYLHAFRLGTRNALYENGRESLTITLDELNAHRVGALMALFERAVGLYAELINVNAYHQPGVEAGKKAAHQALDLQRKVFAYLRSHPGRLKTAQDIAAALDESEAVESIHHLLEHAAANPDHDLRRTPGGSPFDARYGIGR